MLYICFNCNDIVHCDLMPCHECHFSPKNSELCKKIWNKLGDGEFVTCDYCHDVLRRKKRKVLVVDDCSRLSINIESRIVGGGISINPHIDFNSRECQSYVFRDYNVNDSREQYRHEEQRRRQQAKSSLKLTSPKSLPGQRKR